jgi:hypothetical protein
MGRYATDAEIIMESRVRHENDKPYYIRDEDGWCQIHFRGGDDQIDVIVGEDDSCGLDIEDATRICDQLNDAYFRGHHDGSNNAYAC